MKYEVINISTSTERYIANGVLTHNKGSGTSACPSGTAYNTGVTTVYFSNTIKPEIFYQISYVPSLPIIVTFVNDTSDNNYFTITANGTKCVGTSTTPMTKITFNPSTVSTATQMDPKSPTNLGWTSKTTVHVTGSVTRLNNVTSDGVFHWSAAMTARDSSNRSATNSWSTINSAFASVTGGNLSPTSCLTLDTLIQKYDGNTLFLNDIEVGDNLMSINPETNQYESSIVTSKTYHTVDELYLINNGLLRCSKYHKHIIKRNQNWIVITSDQLLIGDILLTKDLVELEIKNIDILK